MLQSWCNNNYSLGMGSRNIMHLHAVQNFPSRFHETKLLFLLSKSTHSFLFFVFVLFCFVLFFFFCCLFCFCFCFCFCFFCWDNLRTLKLVSANVLILALAKKHNADYLKRVENPLVLVNWNWFLAYIISKESSEKCNLYCHDKISCF